MRRPSLAELALLARVLAPFLGQERPNLARKILAEVEAGALHLRVSGRSHPDYGDGSLMARCLALSPIPEPLADDPVFLSALITACRAFRSHSKS